jgi:signal transduction histidine kinase
LFTKARLRITLLYATLMGLTLVLVAGAIAGLAIQEARHSPPRPHPTPAGGGAPRAPRFGPPAVGIEVPDADNPTFMGGLEREGILSYVLPVQDGAPVSTERSTIPSLPDLPAAQRALAAGDGRYDTISIAQGQVRLYSLPFRKGDQIVAVAQVARSRYFLESSVTRLFLIALGVGAVGLGLTTATGYWLAGRTLRPIARAMERQRAFTSDASHELRTPLSLVRGNAELLTRHPERPIGDYMDVVQDIVDESDRLSRLVSNLLTLARSDEGRLLLACSEVDLSEIGAALVRQFQPMAAMKGLALRADIALGVTAWGDRDRLRELGVILVDNAVRYTQCGEVTVCVAVDGAHAVLSVTDNGPGIAAEHLDRLFERFYRTDSARTTTGGGAGLGLAIARWIAESHGSDIQVDSQVGRGSTFSVRLRLQPHASTAGSEWQRTREPGTDPNHGSRQRQ